MEYFNTGIIICECNSIEHQLIFRKFKDEREIYLQIHLNKKPFFKRLKYAFKYLFGYKCRFGAFDEVITTKEELQKIINNL